MTNGKYRYRIKRYLDSIPTIEPVTKVEVPDTVLYGNIIILTNAHNSSFNPAERYTLAMVEKESERFGNITILSGKNAGNVYNKVPYYGGNFHFNDYKGDTYFGANFNRMSEQRDKTNKNSMAIVPAIIALVEYENKKEKQKADELVIQMYSRPEY